MKKKILALVLSITLAVSPIVFVQAEEQQETVDITEPEVQTEEIQQDALEEDVSTEEDQNDTSSEPEQTDGVQNDILADDAETAEVQESETPEVDPSNITVGGYIDSDLDYNTPVYNAPQSRSRRARAAAIPSAYQIDKSMYPAVKNQGSYGTCWAFATL